MRALRKSLLVIVTAWAMCGMTAPPAYAWISNGSQVIASAQMVNGAQVAVPR